MKIIYKITILLFLLSSCSNIETADSIDIEIYNENSAILVDYEKVDTDYLYSYPECLILDSNGNLIIKDELNKEYLFHVINLTSGNLLCEFGKKGVGPNEYMSSTLNPYFDYESQTLSFFDPNGRKYHSFKCNLNHESLSYKHKDTKFIKCDASIREVMKGENCYILTGENKVFNSHRFAIADNNWNITKSCCEYPNITSLLIEPKEDFRQMLYNCVFYRVSPNKEKAIFATYKGTLLQFLDISENIDSVKILKSILLDRPMKKEKRDNKHAGWVYGFEDVYVTNDFIYAIYNGKTVKENPMFGNNILIYNWNGELVNSYKTDIYLRNIAVDEKRNIVYVIACKEESDFFLAKIIFKFSNV